MSMEIKTPKVLGDLSFRLGGIVMPIYSYTTTPVVVADTDWGFFKCGINNTAQAITLPALTAASGKMFIFKCAVSMGSGTVTLTPTSGTIDGQGTFVMDAQYESVMLFCDGSNWFVVNKITT